MKLLAVIFLAATALAEPPVNNRYLPPSQSYGAPGFGGQRQTDAIIRRPSFNQRRPSSTYGPPQKPSNQYGPPQDLPNQYLPPSASESLSYLPPQNSRLTQPSTQYGPPNQYSTPSQEYGPPGFGRGNTRFSPNGFGSNPGYNRPQNRQYLPPNQGGYGYDDGSNGEPANYNFEYMVKDEPSGNDFGHRESRQGDRAEGVYYVLLPDGRKQTVEYEADENGYRPKITYQDTGLTYNRNQGYDGNQGYDRNQGGYNRNQGYNGGYQY